MKNTKIARDAKSGALKRIRDNIEKIYDDFIVNEKVNEFQKTFYVDDNFYKKYKKATKEVVDIEELVNFLNDRWLKQMEEENKMLEANNKIFDLVYADEVATAKEVGREWPSREQFKIEHDDFIKNFIPSIMRGASLVFERININPDLWRSIYAAMLMAVPIKKVFECEKSILDKHFAPKINNGHLIIRINELTLAKDMNIIWDEVEKRQNEFSKKHEYINSLAEYPSRKADKIITLNSQKGLDYDSIHKELRRAGIKRKYTRREIRERINEYKKQTRQPF